MPAPIKQPNLPVVTIQKNDASLYTFNQFTSTFDFKIREARYKPPFDAKGGNYEMTIVSNDISNSGANTILSNILESNEITVSIGKSDGTKTKVFLGIIESIEVYEPNKDYMEIILSGPDWGSDILKNRRVNDSWIQRKDLTDPNKVDPTDLSTTGQQIALDLLTRVKTYPDRNYPVPIDTQGMVVSAGNIAGSDIQISQFEANMETVDDKLNELDDMLNTVHYVDPNKTFFMKKATSVNDSGIILVDDINDVVLNTWTASLIGYIARETKYKKTVENQKGRIFGIGASTIGVDQQQATTSGTTNSLLNANYIAQKFTPTFIDCYNIAVYMGYVGSPNVNLTLFLVQDKAGLPVGSTVRSIDFAKSQVTPGGDWIFAPIGDKLTIGKDYWIIMSKGGQDASNTYRWYNDNIDHNPALSATSTDGITYALTSTSNRYSYAFKEFKNDPLVKISPIGVTSSTKHLHDEVLRRADINDKLAMNTYIDGLSTTLLKRKEIFKGRIFVPDTLLQPGQLVRIKKSTSGLVIDSKYLIGEMEYVFESSDDLTTGSFYVDLEATKYTTYP